MGWAKYEEDNREARNDRWASGNYFWTPYTSQYSGNSECYSGSYKNEMPRQQLIQQATKKTNTYAYGY